jgi:glutathione S-transferase
MIFLHHYPTSPWAEVVRLSLGLKGLTWQSVEVQSTCPKPDLEALTGGYVRVPVLQIGADIYCDTAAIVEALEAYQPDPTLFPRGDETRALAATAQGATFFAAVGAAFEYAPADGMADFWADRERRFGMKRDQLTAMTPALFKAFEAHLDTLEDRLAHGEPWLEGDAPGHADFAHYQLLWFQDLFGAGTQRFTGSRPDILGWTRRVATVGHGHPVHSTENAAASAAFAATPTPVETMVDPASGFSPGETVAVSQTGCFDPPTVGELLVLDARRIIIRRDSTDFGVTHVHFPRAGQEVKAA